MIINVLKSYRKNHIIFPLNKLRNQHFHPAKSVNMPLVVPGITSGGASSKTDDWMNKLAGKKLGETTDATTFAKSELPKETRVIQPGQMVTKDFNPERLNVHLAEDGTVRHVDHQ